MPARLALPLAAVMATSVAAFADAPKTGFVNKTFKNADGSTSPYVVFVPHGYDPAKPTPVILFLHGSGETKGGKKAPVEVGIGTHIKGKREATFPAVVIFPQSEKRTWQADSADGKRAMAMLDAKMKEYNGDPARVYLTGLSMGGFGTWSLAAADPGRWAAIVPICGGGDPKAADKIKDVPCWCWHGAVDPTVKVERSRQMVDALKKAGGHPKYTELPGVNHFSWDPAYGDDALYTWLFAQTKK